MSDATHKELLALNQKLLDSIAASDWNTYKSLCDTNLSAVSRKPPRRLFSGWNFTNIILTSVHPRTGY